MEIWKDIEWYDWKYQVSHTWSVKSFCKVHEKVLRPRKDTRWYLKVLLCRDWICKQYFIHRLVATYFIYNDWKPQVNHIDWDKTNNHVDNLEWVTNSQNMSHSYSQWLRKAIFWSKHVRSRKIDQISKEWKHIKTWWCIMDIERQLWLSNSTISKVCQWKIKTSWWFVWRYCEQ